MTASFISSTAEAFVIILSPLWKTFSSPCGKLCRQDATGFQPGTKNIAAGVEKAEADAIKAQLEEVGAVVEFK